MTSNEREYLELQGRMVEILESINDIKNQLSIAKARCARMKDYSDSAWFHSANHALKQKQVEHQKMLMEASALKKKIHDEKQENNREDRITFERAFILEAKDFLDTDVFQELIKRTERAVTQDEEETV